MKRLIWFAVIRHLRDRFNCRSLVSDVAEDLESVLCTLAPMVPDQ